MKAEDRFHLIDKIKGLEGITDDERAALLGLLRKSKTYGLVWEDKPEQIEDQLRTDLPVLTEVKERAIISDSVEIGGAAQVVVNQIVIQTISS